MQSNSVVVLFDGSVATGADGLPDIGLPLLDWVRIGALTAVRVQATDFDSTLRLFTGYAGDSEQPENERQMPAGIGPWRWDCYDQCFTFAAGEGWPPTGDGPAT